VKVDVKTVDTVQVVQLEGEIDASTASVVQQQIVPLALPGCRILLDMTNVPYMSSAGLRLLLSTYRQVSGKGGKIALVGLAEEIRDTMSVTGFLPYFTTCDDVAAGVAALSK
jgi:anti-sigma B factor antagonist